MDEIREQIDAPFVEGEDIYVITNAWFSRYVKELRMGRDT